MVCKQATAVSVGFIHAMSLCIYMHACMYGREAYQHALSECAKTSYYLL
jgi:hypothetical protein